VAHEFEVGIGQQVRDVVFGAGEEVVRAEDIVAFGQEALAQVGDRRSGPPEEVVRAEESGAAGYEDAFAGAVGSHLVILRGLFASKLSTKPGHAP
jgi:hypothetical protein